MEKTNDEQLKREMTFHHYGRYAILRDIINANRNGAEKFRVLDVGGQGDLMKKFLPRDDVFYLDPLVESKDENFIKGDGCAIPMGNESFDWVVSTDVFEHIPEEKRDDFLKENFRVAKKAMLVAAPFFSREVEEAEKNANDNHKHLTGEDHIWLKEHISNGLPEEKHIVEFAKKNDVKYSRFSNNLLFLWQALIGLEFIAFHNFDEPTRKEFQDFNYFFNTEIFPHDSGEPSYRKIYFLKKTDGLRDPEKNEKRMSDSTVLLVLKKAVDFLIALELEKRK